MVRSSTLNTPILEYYEMLDPGFSKQAERSFGGGGGGGHLRELVACLA